MMIQELEKIIPGLAELRAAERRARVLPWVAGEVPLCGVWVRQLTLRHELELEFAGNRFFTRTGAPEKIDVYRFLWRLSASFTRHAVPFSAAWFARRKIVAEVRTQRERDLVRAVRLFIVEAEQDRPPTKCADPNQAVGVEPETGHHWIASYVNFFAEEYGWSGDTMLDAPVAWLNQLYRAHRAYHGKPVPTFNRSERLIADSVRAARKALEARKQKEEA